MSDHVELKFHLEAKGLSLDTFGWPDLREFLDLLLPAIAAMDGAPTAADMLPVRVEDGSAQPVVRMPHAGMKAAYRFRAGPTRAWTFEQRVKAGRVYDFLAERDARLSCGVRTLKPVEVPSDRPSWRIRQATTLTGAVRRAGGSRGRVEVGFDELGHVHCDAGRTLAKELAEHLYERVAVSGFAEKDARTGALVSFRIDSFRLLKPTRLGAALDELHDLLGDDLQGFDPSAFMKELRG